MKWFRHNSDMRNELVAKLIRTKFGAEGYGIYLSLKEIVASNIENDNTEEWGCVHPLHTIETLAKECETNPEKLKEFLEYCNEIGVIEKKDGKLYDPLIKNELDNFFTRVQKKNKLTSQ